MDAPAARSKGARVLARWWHRRTDRRSRLLAHRPAEVGRSERPQYRRQAATSLVVARLTGWLSLVHFPGKMDDATPPRLGFRRPRPGCGLGDPRGAAGGKRHRLHWAVETDGHRSVSDQGRDGRARAKGRLAGRRFALPAEVRPSCSGGRAKTPTPTAIRRARTGGRRRGGSHWPRRRPPV